MSATPVITNESPTARDRVRKWIVLIGALIAVAGAVVGSGAFGGTPINEAANGALAADATLLSPSATAFTIWSFIYAGLLIFAGHQLVAAQASNPRLRAVAWWVLASMLLNAAWIGVIQAGWLWVSVLVIVALVVVLGVIARRLVLTPAQTWTERLTTDAPIGLYLGWVVVATVANVTSAVAAAISGFSAGDGAMFAVAVLVVVAALSVVITRGLRSSATLSITTGVALAWGLWWIALGRLGGSPESIPVGWIAGLAAIVALCTPFAVRDFRHVGRRDPLAPA